MLKKIRYYDPKLTIFYLFRVTIDSHTVNELTDLKSELEMMKTLGEHENIIKLLGCCTDREGSGTSIYIIFDFAPFGNLRDFLRQHKLGTHDADGKKEIYLHPYLKCSITNLRGNLGDLPNRNI